MHPPDINVIPRNTARISAHYHRDTQVIPSRLSSRACCWRSLVAAAVGFVVSRGVFLASIPAWLVQFAGDDSGIMPPFFRFGASFGDFPEADGLRSVGIYW